MHRRVGLAVIVLVGTAWLCSTALGALRRPTLPVRAAPNSVASFPCPPNPLSTIDIEACEGHKQLKLDREFNKLTAALWPILDMTGRRELVRAHTAWLTYSDEECRARTRSPGWNSSWRRFRSMQDRNDKGSGQRACGDRERLLRRQGEDRRLPPLPSPVASGVIRAQWRRRCCVRRASGAKAKRGERPCCYGKRRLACSAEFTNAVPSISAVVSAMSTSGHSHEIRRGPDGGSGQSQ